MVSHKDIGTGVARPSSVRDVNCSLKWGNERNPYCLLYVSGKTAPLFTPDTHRVDARCDMQKFSLKTFAVGVKEGGGRWGRREVSVTL